MGKCQFAHSTTTFDQTKLLSMHRSEKKTPEEGEGENGTKDDEEDDKVSRTQGSSLNLETSPFPFPPWVSIRANS